MSGWANDRSFNPEPAATVWVVAIAAIAGTYSRLAR
jgi:hypothetical protein